eukprot:PhF_6_TR43405/c0_g2_i1/m.66654
MGRQNTYGGLMTGNMTLCKGVGITPALSLSSSSANSEGLNQRGALKRLRSLVTGVELASVLSHPEPVLESQIAMQIIQVNCIAGDEIGDDDFFLESWDTVGSFLQLYVGFFFILLLLVVYSVHTLFGGLIYLLYPRVTRMDLRFPYLSIKYNIMCIIPSLDVVFRLSKKSSQPLPVAVNALCFIFILIVPALCHYCSVRLHKPKYSSGEHEPSRLSTFLPKGNWDPPECILIGGAFFHGNRGGLYVCKTKLLFAHLSVWIVIALSFAATVLKRTMRGRGPLCRVLLGIHSILSLGFGVTCFRFLPARVPIVNGVRGARWVVLCAIGVVIAASSTQPSYEVVESLAELHMGLGLVDFCVPVMSYIANKLNHRMHAKGIRSSGEQEVQTKEKAVHTDQHLSATKTCVLEQELLPTHRELL